MTPDPAASPCSPTATPQRSNVPMRVDSRALLGEGTELVISHNGREYRLRVTQNGKLILTA